MGISSKTKQVGAAGAHYIRQFGPPGALPAAKFYVSGPRFSTTPQPLSPCRLTGNPRQRSAGICSAPCGSPKCSLEKAWPIGLVDRSAGLAQLQLISHPHFAGADCTGWQFQNAACVQV